ncbi:MAG: 1-deoxy-D-xylulose-5-phosphate reductoisomerase [Spirochaetes bacterium]|jgi:1-deoxy-D-xylulose-5-phosphate reductoisomerase|nr:1-deoxy-D-xylulose-5-phosphate reductoisomerase [Spirochaetota bacterium]
MPREVIILGSTGSIGCSTLRVIDEHPDLFSVKALVCNSNISCLTEQLCRYKPSFCGITSLNDSSVDSLRSSFPDTSFFIGKDAAIDVVAEGADICVSAIVGAAGFLPSLAALKSCKRIALANKETLVMGGELFFNEASRCKSEVIPVDSEHSAVFALLNGLPDNEVESVVLTASGGSLREYPLDQLSDVTPDQALAHPTWNMGCKITIDSATLMNKGFEVIEAHHLFSLPYDKIKVLVHPESLIHSLVQTVGGALHAHLGVADMVFPISYALLYPEIIPNSFKKLDLVEAGSLTFKKLDDKRYPALLLCYEAGLRGGLAPAILNASNEVAVHAFLNRKIRFTQIVEVVDVALNELGALSSVDVGSILDADARARVVADDFIKKLG